MDKGHREVPRSRVSNERFRAEWERLFGKEARSVEERAERKSERKAKGQKNKLSLLKEAVLASAETMLLVEFEKIVQATLTLAAAGDPTALKIVWDRILPAKRTVEDRMEGEDKLNISINITGMEVKEIGGEPVETSVIEAEFKEIPEK